MQIPPLAVRPSNRSIIARSRPGLQLARPQVFEEHISSHSAFCHGSLSVPLVTVSTFDVTRY